MFIHYLRIYHGMCGNLLFILTFALGIEASLLSQTAVSEDSKFSHHNQSLLSLSYKDPLELRNSLQSLCISWDFNANGILDTEEFVEGMSRKAEDSPMKTNKSLKLSHFTGLESLMPLDSSKFNILSGNSRRSLHKGLETLWQILTEDTEDGDINLKIRRGKKSLSLSCSEFAERYEIAYSKPIDYRRDVCESSVDWMYSKCSSVGGETMQKLMQLGNIITSSNAQCHTGLSSLSSYSLEKCVLKKHTCHDILLCYDEDKLNDRARKTSVKFMVLLAMANLDKSSDVFIANTDISPIEWAYRQGHVNRSVNITFSPKWSNTSFITVETGDLSKKLFLEDFSAIIDGMDSNGDNNITMAEANKFNDIIKRRFRSEPEHPNRTFILFKHISPSLQAFVKNSEPSYGIPRNLLLNETYKQLLSSGPLHLDIQRCHSLYIYEDFYDDVNNLQPFLENYWSCISGISHFAEYHTESINSQMIASKSMLKLRKRALPALFMALGAFLSMAAANLVIPITAAITAVIIVSLPILLNAAFYIGARAVSGRNMRMLNDTRVLIPNEDMDHSQLSSDVKEEDYKYDPFPSSANSECKALLYWGGCGIPTSLEARSCPRGGKLFNKDSCSSFTSFSEGSRICSSNDPDLESYYSWNHQNATGWAKTRYLMMAPWNFQCRSLCVKYEGNGCPIPE